METETGVEEPRGVMGRRPATYADLEALPEHVVGELIEGVRHVWFVDPDARTLEVFRLEGTNHAPRATHTGTARVHAEPFEALELELAALWDEV